MPTLALSEVQSVRCPECRALKGRPCVYLPPVSTVDREFLHYRSPAVQQRVARTGTPTKRPHNARYNQYNWLADRRRRRTTQQRQPNLIPATAAARTIARAEVEYDRQEYLKLRAWVAAHAHVLINASRY